MLTQIRITQLCFVSLVVLAVAFLAPAAKADGSPAKTEETPRQLIDRLSGEVIGILTNKELTADQKQAKIQAIAFTNIDFPVVSRLTLGGHWRGLNETQRADFMKEYRTHLSNTYRGMIDGYTDEQVKTIGDREEDRGDRTVMTKVIDPKTSDESNAIKVNYRVRHEEAGWRIVDITVEGVSLVANFKAQFQDIISNRGFDGLMKMLREKNAEAATNPAKAESPNKSAAATQGAH